MQQQQDAHDCTAAHIALLPSHNMLFNTPPHALQIYGDLTNECAVFPWDETRLSQDDRVKLGRFYGPVQKLLQRDPCMRGTAHDFCAALRELY